MASKLTDETLPAYLSTLPADTPVVNLSNNLLTSKSCAALQSLLEKNKSLVTLDLSNNDIDAEGAGLLSFALQLSTTLKTLRLADNKFGGKGALAVASALQVNTSLTSLDVGGTDLDMESLIAFTTVMTNNRTLTSLVLDRPLLSSVGEEIATHVSRMLVLNNTLEHLSLRKHHIGETGLARIAEALLRNKTLRSLDLACNKITRDGAASIARALAAPVSLLSLQLDSNAIDDDGAIAIAHAITRSNIESLSLAHNRIRGPGMDALSFVAAKTPRLTCLRVWGNPAICGATTNTVVCEGLVRALAVRGASLTTDVRPYEVDGKHYLAEES